MKLQDSFVQEIECKSGLYKEGIVSKQQWKLEVEQLSNSKYSEEFCLLMCVHKHTWTCLGMHKTLY